MGVGDGVDGRDMKRAEVEAGSFALMLLENVCVLPFRATGRLH